MGNLIKALILFYAVSLAFMTGDLKAQIPIEQEFLKLEQEWTGALARQDSVRLAELLNPDFTLIGAGATADTPLIDRSLYLRNSMSLSWPHRKVQILDVQIHDNTAVVRCVWQGTEPPPFELPPPEGGVYKFLLTDVWVHSNNGWQVLARHSSFGYDAIR